MEHKADATAKYGRPAPSCRAAHILPPDGEDVLHLDPTAFEGGIALWGAVPPIYDTTRLPLEHGIHVHARPEVGGKKTIDKTVRRVELIGGAPSFPEEGLVVSELDAIYYMVTSVFGYAYCCGAGWLMAMGAGSEMRIARRERGLSLA